MNTKALRQKILDLAIHGKLVPQDPNDEPASVLLERIKAEKERLIKEGKIKRTKRSKAACDKPHYENETPFEVPTSWEWATIGDIAESNIGLTYKPTDICDYGIPVYRSNNIQNRCIDKTDLVRVDTKILDKQFLAIGDLLICARNGSRRLVGKCALIEELTEPTSFGAFMAVCRSIYNPWICLLLNTNYFDRYLDDSNSTTINQVTQTMLLAFKIPFPPKKEQERIIKEVHKWFNLIDEVENESKRLQAFITVTKSKILYLAIHGKLVPQDPTDEPASELLKRINPNAKITCDNPHYRKLPFQIPSTWAWCSHNDVLEISGGSQPAKRFFSSVPQKGYVRLYQIRDYGENPIPVYIPIEYAMKQTEEGDILLARYGGSLGKVFHAEKGAYNVAMAKVIFKDKDLINKEYAYFYYLSDLYQGRLKEISRTAQAGFNSSDFNEMYFPLPPYEEQQRIVNAINKAFTTLDVITENL